MAAVSVFTGRWRQTSHWSHFWNPNFGSTRSKKIFMTEKPLNPGFKTLAVNIFLLLPDNDYILDVPLVPFWKKTSAAPLPLRSLLPLCQLNGEQWEDAPSDIIPERHAESAVLRDLLSANTQSTSSPAGDV